MFGPREFRFSDGGSGFRVMDKTDQELAAYFGMSFPDARTIENASSSYHSETACQSTESIDRSKSLSTIADDAAVHDEINEIHQPLCRPPSAQPLPVDLSHGPSRPFNSLGNE
ncbi:hypothetical protein FRB98_000581, partial [Tulasnella sp. 332]